MTTRTRFAPSPTGFLHIGNLRTLLFAYAKARHDKGQFLLRIEDTDQNRFIEKSEENIFKILEIFGMTPNESPQLGGDFGPYKQSERLPIYKKYAQELIKKGHAYHCFLKQDELGELKKDRSHAFRSPHRALTDTDVKNRIESGEEFVIRYKVPNDTIIKFHDEIQGEIEVNSNDIDDWVMIKSDGFPTYNYAVVIDDHLMEITHVFRGFEFIPSAPKNIMLYKNFGWDTPKLCHLPVIVKKGGGKLSKRKDNVSTESFLEKGFLKEAILNFIMLLGWAAPIQRVHGEKEKEIFSLNEFIEMFEIKDLNKSNPTFNLEKLVWFNKEYIQNKTQEDLFKEYTYWLKTYNPNSKLLKVKKNTLEESIELIKDKCNTLADIEALIEPIIEKLPEPNFGDIKQTKSITAKDIKKILAIFLEELEKKDSISSWGHNTWENFIREKIIKSHKYKPGQVFMTLRLALLKTPISPPLFESMEILEKEKVRERIQRTIKILH